MKQLAFATWIACAAVAGAQAPDRHYVLAYQENFQGDQVDTTRWNFRTDSKAFSTQLPANVAVHEGKLYITPRPEAVAGMRFTGGGIISKAAFRYGYFEVDAKTTADFGWHTAFWMMAGDGKTTFTGAMHTEIDDFEIETPEHISMGYLSWNGNQNLASKRCNNDYVPGYSTAAGMHRYGLEWTDTSLRYFLDGKEVCQQSYTEADGMHDRLNIWLTIIAARDSAAASGHSPAVFSDVKYYVRDYAIAAGEPEYAEHGLDWHPGAEPGFSGLASRVSCSADAQAIWTPSILEKGLYKVQLWHVRNSAPVTNGDATAEVHHAGGTAKIAIEAGHATGWVDLGTFTFDRGVTGAVSLSRTGSKGCLQANMVRFLRQ